MTGQYRKSPMNYIGGKYKIIDQITKYFPRQLPVFVDLFAGGLDVSINVNAGKIYCNDLNFFVIGIYEAFQKMEPEEAFSYLDAKIEEYQLSKTNKEGFLRFRGYYNREEQKNPLDLYLLMCYSFNYQFRFNSNHEYNSPFGANRSSFNPVMRDNLRNLFEQIQTFNFTSYDFKQFPFEMLKEGDFVYADPPYRITTGSYNDGKRGFDGWNTEADLALFQCLDGLHERGILFALSNVTQHKGVRNKELIQWKKKYKTHRIRHNYNNCNYQADNKNNITREVLITNY